MYGHARETNCSLFVPTNLRYKTEESSPRSFGTFEPTTHSSSHSNDEVNLWLNGYVNKQNRRIWSEANPQVYVETPLHPEKLTVWCALWAGRILLQKR
ncbi:hypothetical protein TNCV_931661 [Trichonephila clavipes]|uniref:Uncharacterized protein n=1 Tax=Trichonephila clavipes TaxID=2585209 RepID=A0A8X6W2V0_TRICX|nr:hypothetical protein TNCV_931661 [Trichonephila clavipes]